MKARMHVYRHSTNGKVRTKSVIGFAVLMSMYAVYIRGAVADWQFDFEDGREFAIVQHDTRNGDVSPSLQQTTEGGILKLVDTRPIGDGGAFRVIALDPEIIADSHVEAIVNPNGSTNSGTLGVLSRSDGRQSYWAGLASFLDGSDQAGFIVGKTFDDEVVLRLSSWEADVPKKTFSPFTTPYIVDLTVTDKLDESGAPYTNVVGRLLDVFDSNELVSLSFRDTGQREPRILSGMSGVHSSITQRVDSAALHATFDDVHARVLGNSQLQAGDADQDFDFDQFDLVRVQQSSLYLTGEPATWGEGDWNGAPGGSQGDPPVGNALFDQLDIIAALAGGAYLKGPYAVVAYPGMQEKTDPAETLKTVANDHIVTPRQDFETTPHHEPRTMQGLLNNSQATSFGRTQNLATADWSAFDIEKSPNWLAMEAGFPSAAKLLPSGMDLFDADDSDSDVEISLIPEPTTAVLMLFGLLGPIASATTRRVSKQRRLANENKVTPPPSAAGRSDAVAAGRGIRCAID